MRPIFASHVESDVLIAPSEPNRYRRSSANSRERQRAAIAELDVAERTSLAPMGLVALQTTATLAACAASFTLRRAPSSAAHSAAWGAGFVVAACAAQSVQLGVSWQRRVDSLVAVCALSLSSLSIGCAGTAIIPGLGSPQSSAHWGFAACLLGLSWLGHVAAIAAQLHRDEIAWDISPMPHALAGSPGAFGVLAGTSAALALGGVACVIAAPSRGLPYLEAQGAVLVALSVAAAAVALSSGMRAVDRPR